MKISRKSWHYKTQCEVFDTETSNLCLYCWRTIFALLVMTVLLSLLFVVVVVTNGFLFKVRGYRVRSYYLVTFATTVWLLVTHGNDVVTLAVRVATEPVFLAVVGILAGAAALYVIGTKVRHLESWKLMKTWIKARKDGVCPIIEYEDESPIEERMQESAVS